MLGWMADLTAMRLTYRSMMWERETPSETFSVSGSISVGPADCLLTGNILQEKKFCNCGQP